MLLCLVVSLSAQSDKKVIDYKGPDGHTVTYRLYEQSATAEVAPPKENLSNHYDYETLVIPEHVVYKGKNYAVTSLGIGAFSFSYDKKSRTYKYIKSITLPKSIKEIKSGAYYKKTEIHISDLDAWCRINRANILPTEKLYLKGNLVTHVTFPYMSFNKIKESAFYEYQPLDSIFIPHNVTAVGKAAFKGCGLRSVWIPSSVTHIENEAFSGCAMKELVIPSTVRMIGADAFSYCQNLEEVKINMRGAVPAAAFGRCKNLKKVVIGPHVTSISKQAFVGCTALTDVIILDNPSLAIEGYAFDGCVSLANVQGLTAKNRVDANAFAFESSSSGKSRTPYSFADVQKTFSYYATSKVEAAIEQWQKKGEFETTEQWRQRVTVARRDEEVKKVIEQIRQAYIAKMKVAEPLPTLLSYDADRGVQTVQIGSETLYVKVPVSEAQQFKANFKPEYIRTQYDIANDRLAVVGRTCQVGNKVYETTNTYAKADNLNDIALNLPPLELDFGGGSSSSGKAAEPAKVVDRTIDQNIPTSNVTNSNTFAVIIGNENYSLVAKVPYAKNDAQVLAEYCRKTLGLPAKNVRTYGDATYAMLLAAVKDIQDIAKAYDGNINVLFYYAGHGIPDEKNKDAYLLPVDADGRQTSFCYPVSKLYQELGSLNVKSVVVLMDACFSGALRGDGMLMAARGVAIKPKAEAPQGRMVVLTAASGEETAYPYEEKGHGMFTYFLLKKLRDTKGGCTLGELSDYIKSNVQQQSVVVNRKSQTPTVSSSTSVANSWRNMKLK